MGVDYQIVRGVIKAKQEQWKGHHPFASPDCKNFVICLEEIMAVFVVRVTYKWTLFNPNFPVIFLHWTFIIGDVTY